MIHGADVVGHDFVQVNDLCRRRRIGRARRASVGGAGLPVGGFVGAAVGVDDFKRAPAAVRRSGPAVLVVVIHRGDDITKAVEERDALARVVQIAAEPAGDSHAGVLRFPGVRLGVRTEHQPGACAQCRAFIEHERDAVEIHAAQINRGAGNILQFDEFMQRAGGRVVHDFSDAQRNAQRSNRERGLDHGAPDPGLQRTRPDVDGAVEWHGATVGRGGRRHRARKRHARVAAVGGVVDRAREVRHRQAETHRHAPAELAEHRCV